MPFKPPIDMNTRNSASAIDADSSLRSQDAADKESAMIDAWTKPAFAQGGRHQLQVDPSFGYFVKGRGRK